MHGRKSFIALFDDPSKKGCENLLSLSLMATKNFKIDACGESFIALVDAHSAEHGEDV